MKYIIKNCNCFNLGACCTPNSDRLYCKDIANCCIKRIIDICKTEKKKGFVLGRYGCKESISEGYDLACRILQKLEIEECEK